VAQDVRGDGLGYSGLAGGLTHGSLNVDLMQVMTAGASGARVDGKSGRREHVLPAPFAGASAVFEGDAVGQFHIAVTLGQIRLVNGAHFGDLLPQFLDKRNRQRGDAVLAAVDGSAAGGSTLRARLRRVCLTASQAVRLPRRTTICMSSRSMSLPREIGLHAIFKVALAPRGFQILFAKRRIVPVQTTFPINQLKRDATPSGGNLPGIMFLAPFGKVVGQTDVELPVLQGA
jgi:hypothetical protein